MEELFTITRPEWQDAFISCILALAYRPKGLRVSELCGLTPTWMWSRIRSEVVDGNPGLNLFAGICKNPQIQPVADPFPFAAWRGWLIKAVRCSMRLTSSRQSKRSSLRSGSSGRSAFQSWPPSQPASLKLGIKRDQLGTSSSERLPFSVFRCEDYRLDSLAPIFFG